MAYFNHAYRQTYVPSSLITAKGTATSALKRGEIAFIDAATYKSVQIPASATSGLGTSAANGTQAVVAGTGTTPNIVSNMGMPSTSGYMIAQGNFNNAGSNTAGTASNAGDIIGGNALHGGYAASYKSKIIIPKYLTALYKDGATCGAVDTAVIDVQIPNSCIKCDGSTSLQNQVRIDLKGNAVLRFLNRFAYSTFYLKDCCVASPDVAGYVDGDTAATALAALINDDPLINPFVTATVVAGTAPGAAGNNKVRLTVGYTATFFDNCSFDTRDNVDTEPITMTVTVLDEDGDACTDTCLTGAATSGGTQAAMPAEGLTVELMKQEKTGESVLRDLILDRRYSQDGGHNQGNRDSARFREIEGGDNILGAVDRTAFYRNYKIQHTVPRFNNPTGVFDNDQYLYEIHIPCGSDSDTFYTNFGKFMDGLAIEAKTAGRYVPVTQL